MANCWLLSSIACLTEYQDAIPVLFADRGRAISEFNKARQRAARTRSSQAQPFRVQRCSAEAALRFASQIRVFNKALGKWRVLQVTESVPCDVRSYKLVCSELVKHRDMAAEGWLTLLEKAFAMYVGGYPRLAGGTPAAALEALTGDPVRTFAFDSEKGRWAELALEPDLARVASTPNAPPPRVTAQLEHEALWTLLKDSFAAGHLVAAGTEGVIQSGQEDRQAYAVVELHEIGSVRLLCVRNPWGSFRWKGDWSAESELWDVHPDVCSAVNPVLDTDSEFYITFDDLRHSFYQLYICARGAGRNTSLKFLAAAAFTEPADLARQQGGALSARRVSTKRFYGVSSCLPRSRNMLQSIGAQAGHAIRRVHASTAAVVGSCASVSRKGPGAGLASPAEASLDDEQAGASAAAAPVVGAPATTGTVMGRPWAAVAALRGYLQTPGAAAAAAADAGTVAGAPAAAGAAPATGAAAAGGTVLGYAVWPSARWSNIAQRPGPVTILRAYWRGEPLPTAAAAAAAAPQAAAPAAAAPDADVDAAPGTPVASAAEGMPMTGRPAGFAAASDAAADDVVDGIPPMPMPASLPETRPGNMRAPAPTGSAWLAQAATQEVDDDAGAPGGGAAGMAAGEPELERMLGNAQL